MSASLRNLFDAALAANENWLQTKLNACTLKELTSRIPIEGANITVLEAAVTGVVSTLIVNRILNETGNAWLHEQYSEALIKLGENLMATTDPHSRWQKIDAMHSTITHRHVFISPRFAPRRVDAVVKQTVTSLMAAYGPGAITAHVTDQHQDLMVDLMLCAQKKTVKGMNLQLLMFWWSSVLPDAASRDAILSSVRSDTGYDDQKLYAQTGDGSLSQHLAALYSSSIPRKEQTVQSDIVSYLNDAALHAVLGISEHRIRAQGGTGRDNRVRDVIIGKLGLIKYVREADGGSDTSSRRHATNCTDQLVVYMKQPNVKMVLLLVVIAADSYDDALRSCLEEKPRIVNSYFQYDDTTVNRTCEELLVLLAPPEA
eukprot:10678-Heterococcus_DN1.PRE.1